MVRSFDSRRKKYRCVMQLNQSLRHLVLLALPFSIQVGAIASETTRLSDNSRLQSACKIEANGEQISIARFSTEGWLTAEVPSTVVAAQVAAGVLPDPYFR